jgi:putative metallohydrolase (TIGR04338 family)
MRERDTQRARLYLCDPVLVMLAKPLPKIVDVERFADKVFASKRVQAAFPKSAKWRHSFKIGDGRGRSRNSCGWYGGITIRPCHRNEAIVLHELAHTICQREYGLNVAGHGWQFCSVYLKLALYMMGREAHDALKKEMKVNRVKFTAPRQRRPMDPVAKAALVARLTAYRATQVAQQ